MKTNKIIIIAEVGVNHNGDIKLAKKLIVEAKKAGADFVKFQSFVPEKMVTVSAKKANYQNKFTSKKLTHFLMLKKLQLSYIDQEKLLNFAKKKKIGFLSSPFDLESANFILSLNIPYIKIPSGEITNLPLLEFIASKKKPVILSTGMSTLKEINFAINILLKNGLSKNKINILHCTSEYPTPSKNVNLNTIALLKETFMCNVGFSDHTLNMEASIAAASIGAKIIEKHITLSNDLDGPDHKSSMEPKDFKKMVKIIRNIEILLGHKKKIISNDEKKNKTIVRKSIVAKKKILKGQIFTKHNLTTKRPGNGISPVNWYKLIGKRSKKNYKIDELI